MEQYRYHKEWEDQCRYGLYLKSCAECLFQALCQFEQNQERICRDTATQEKTL